MALTRLECKPEKDYEKTKKELDGNWWWRIDIEIRLKQVLCRLAKPYFMMFNCKTRTFRKMHPIKAKCI